MAPSMILGTNLSIMVPFVLSVIRAQPAFLANARRSNSSSRGRNASPMNVAQTSVSGLSFPTSATMRSKTGRAMWAMGRPMNVRPQKMQS